MSRARPWLITLLALTTLGSLAVALWGVDPVQFAGAIGSARWLGLPALAIAILANHALRIVRWHVLLGVAPWSRTVPICLVAFLAITLLPLRLGEAVRPALHAADGVPLDQTVAALLAERLLDLFALLLLIGVVTSTVALPGSMVVQGVDVVAVTQRAVTVAVSIGTVSLVLLGMFGHSVAARLPFGGRFADGVSAGLRDLASRPARAGAAALLTVGTWVSTVVYVAAGLACFPNVPGGWIVATTTWAAIISGISALPTPGFFGAYEASGAVALRLFGADATQAAAAVLFLHLAYIAVVAVLGVPAMAREGLGARDLMR